MTKIEKLEQDVRRLGREELAIFREWFQNYDALEWDKQIEGDAICGRLESLAREALEAYKAGDTREL